MNLTSELAFLYAHITDLKGTPCSIGFKSRPRGDDWHPLLSFVWENPGLTSISERQLCQGRVAGASSLIFHWVFWIYNPSQVRVSVENLLVSLIKLSSFCFCFRTPLDLNDVVKSNGMEFQCLSSAWKFSVSIFLNKVLSLWLFSFWNPSVCRLVHLAAPLNPSAGFTRHSFSPDLSPSLLNLPSAWKSLLLKVLVHFSVQSYSLATDFQFACDFCPSVKWLTLFCLVFCVGCLWILVPCSLNSHKTMTLNPSCRPLFLWDM